MPTFWISGIQSPSLPFGLQLCFQINKLPGVMYATCYIRPCSNVKRIKICAHHYLMLT